MTNNLVVCAFKCTYQEVSSEIIPEMQETIQALRIPRGYAAVPALGHLGGVAPSVATAGYFYRMIDIADFL